MNWGVKNYDVGVGHCHINIHTLCKAKNKKFTDSTKKSDENTPNRSEMDNIGLQDGVDIHAMLPVSTLHQYANS